MSEPTPSPPPWPQQPPPLPLRQAPDRGRRNKAWVALGALGALLLKFKALLLPVLKFLPILLKTGGSMFLTIGLYAMAWGWWFALGFVLLIFVHECGHLLAAKRVGLKVGAPVFIPFMGAFIALKEAPRNAWIEAQVGIGGPLLGTVGAVVCYGLYELTGERLLVALAFSGFFLDLFNLAAVGFLDGGRIVTALSPWLWLVGIAIIGGLLLRDALNQHLNLLLLLIFVFSLPRVVSLFRKKTEAELRYFEVTPAQRWIMAALYFGLVAFLVAAMKVTHVRPAQ